MERKKRIFIGSSVESKCIAEQIERKLGERYEVVLWYENFFSIGQHFYKELVTKIISFDFAIMIGGVDDFVERMPQKICSKYAPRDNVYLEYGLFSGFLSANRVLFVIHEQCTIASDLSGMSLAVYSAEEEAVSIAEKWVEQYPERRRSFPEANVELLPVYGIAVGYYYDFIEPLIKALYSAKREELGSDRVRLNICIPDFIIRDPAEYRDLFYADHCLESRLLFNFRIHAEPEASDGVLRLYDVPNTMLALFKTVDSIFGITHWDTEDSICAKHRALESFGEILASLIAQNVYVSMNSDKKRLSVYITPFSNPTE